jgi:broad specificity phosphatase PhoE
MKKIILVRHWEALWNSTWELMWCRIWSNLTEKWKRQALLVTNYLIKNYSIDKFYSSPVSRAIETADIISKEYWNKYVINQNIKEIDFWDMTWKKISEIPKEIDLAYMKDPFFHKHTWWENISDLFERVKKFLDEEVYNSEWKNFLIVTHDNIIKAFVWVLNWITKEVISLKIGNCSIVEYNIFENKVECVNFNLNYYLN